MRRIGSLAVLPLALLAHASHGGEPAAPTRQASPDSVHVLDSRVAEGMGMRLRWQAGLPRSTQARWRGLDLNIDRAGSSDATLTEVAIWDSEGALLCVDGETGKLRWQSQPTSAAQGYESMHRTTIEGRDVLLAVGDHRLVALDRLSGEVMGVSAYRHNPATPAVSMGNMLAFGANGRNLSLVRVFEEDVPKFGTERVTPGRINGLPKREVARKEIVCNEVRSIGLKGKPSSAPQRAGGGRLLLTSEGGEVCLLDLASGRKLWQLVVPGRITTAGAIAGASAFVGADDQYLRCLSLDTGKVRWKWFALAPLDRPILVAGDLVLTQVPGTGLVALKASVASGQVQGNMDGELAWKQESLRGDPVTVLRSGVLTWDAADRTLSLVDQANGKVRESVHLPDVVSVTCSSPIDGELLLLEEGGRLQRCSPLDPMPRVTAASEATASEPAAEPADGGTGEPSVEPTEPEPAPDPGI